MTVENKVALVTGAGQGVGQGIACALAERGARLILVGRSHEKVARTAEQIRERGHEAIALACDVTDPHALDALVADAIAAFGSQTILDNNTQTVIDDPLLSTTDDNYGQVMDSGPLAALRLMRLCHPYLSGGGAIVNIGSAAGVRWDSSGYGLYAAAKEAIRALTRAAACEWARDEIRVNAIIPLSLSPSMADWVEDRPDEAEAFLSTVPLRRLGDPEKDIGAAVAFLCSDDARYITGHSMPVDGGQVLLQ